MRVITARKLRWLLSVDGRAVGKIATASGGLYS
jgi:hypothetical protein